jgi:hypothetical protein
MSWVGGVWGKGKEEEKEEEEEGRGKLMLAINHQTFFFFLSGLPIYVSAPKTLQNRTMICHHSND